MPSPVSFQPRLGLLRLLMLVLLAFIAFRRMPYLAVEIEVKWHQDQETYQAKLVDPTHALPPKEMNDEVFVDRFKAVKHINTPREEEDLMNKTSILPPPMDLWRRNISLDTAYGYSTTPHQLQGDACSCRNPMAKNDCCVRTIRFAHKMGTIMTRNLFRNYQRGRLDLKADDPNKYKPSIKRRVDYRDVLLFRNIYAALKSGYLYHLSGRECWLNHNGKPVKNWNITERRRFAKHKPFDWFNWLAQKVPMSLHQNRSLCQFLQEEDEKVGMRVYIEFVFQGWYLGSFSRWAFAQAFPEVRERTKHACFEDFLSPMKDKQTIESTMSFLFNQTTEWEGKLPGKKEYVGAHSTSHNADPEQSRRLLQIIRELDEEFFNNEIAWVDSVLPC